MHSTQRAIKSGPAPYTLETKYSSTEWGSSGAAILFILQTTAGAVIAEAIHALRDKLAETRQARAEPLSEPEVVQRAKWIVERRYAEPYASLVLKEVTTSDERATTTLVTEGMEYVVDLGLVDGVVTVTKIARRSMRIE